MGAVCSLTKCIAKEIILQYVRYVVPLFYCSRFFVYCKSFFAWLAWIRGEGELGLLNQKLRINIVCCEGNKWWADSPFPMLKNILRYYLISQIQMKFKILKSYVHISWVNVPKGSYTMLVQKEMAFRIWLCSLLLCRSQRHFSKLKLPVDLVLTSAHVRHRPRPE